MNNARMSFEQWLKAMPFEFWVGFVLAVAPLVIALYQLARGNERKAATMFLCTTISVIGALIWAFFGRHSLDSPRGAKSITIRTWEAAPPGVWTNAWPNMTRDPDAVLADDDRNGGRKVLSMWVEGVIFTPEHTMLMIAIKNWAENILGTVEPASGAYIVDDQGRSSYFQTEIRYGRGPFVENGEVEPGTVVHLELQFPQVQPTGSITLKLPEFLPITVYEYRPSVTVSFCRASEQIGASLAIDIFCDGKHIVSLSNGESAEVRLRIGKHSFQARWKPLLMGIVEGRSLELTLRANQTYYIQSVPQTENWVSERPELISLVGQHQCPGSH